MGCCNINLSKERYESSCKGVSIWTTFNKNAFHLTLLHVTEVESPAYIRYICSHLRYFLFIKKFKVVV